MLVGTGDNSPLHFSYKLSIWLRLCYCYTHKKVIVATSKLSVDNKCAGILCKKNYLYKINVLCSCWVPACCACFEPHCCLGMINSLVFYQVLCQHNLGLSQYPGFGKELTAHMLINCVDFGIEAWYFSTSGMNAYLHNYSLFFLLHCNSLCCMSAIYGSSLIPRSEDEARVWSYSSRLSKLLGNQSALTLAAICFQSYSKHHHIIIACC